MVPRSSPPDGHARAESSLAWSPDSRKLAFSARREGDESAQIYLMPLDGGEAQRVTNLSTGASSPKFSPDGSRILFESMVYPGAESDEANRRIAAERKARKWTARVYDTFPFRYWNAWLDDRQAHVFVQELKEGAQPKDLLAGPGWLRCLDSLEASNPLSGGQDLGAVWSPDGQHIVFAAVTNRTDAMFAEVESSLFRVALTGGEPVRLTQPGASFSGPVFSPDGRTLYAEHQKSPESGRIYSLTRLAKVPFPEPGAPQVVTVNWDRSVGGFAISADSSNIFLSAEDDGFDRIFQMSASGGTPRSVVDVKVGGYGVPQVEGQTMIATYGGSQLPPEIVRIDLNTRTHRQLTDFNRARLDQLDLPAPEHFWFTAKNGRKIHSIIFFPPALDRSRKYPLLVFPHGGPNSMSKDAFSTRWNSHFLTAPGYVLLQTNYTGSTGFGEKFADEIERDVLRGPAREILEAVDEAARRYPFIDLSRQAQSALLMAAT